MSRTVVVPAADRPVKDCPGDLLILTCDEHPAMTTKGTAEQARILGWVVWDGVTLAGRETSRTLCPTCTGRAAEGIDVETGEPGEPFGWNGTCDACYAEMWEDWDTDEMPATGWTEEDVREWFRDHDCEPTLTVIPPRARKDVAA